MNEYFEFRLKRTPSCILWYFWVLVITVHLPSKSALADNVIGVISPRNVRIAVGGSANITCRINVTHFDQKNSSCLTFATKDTGTLNSQESIHIVNETSIVLMIRNASKQITDYICKCNADGVGLAFLEVGEPPTDVTDLQCIDYDFSYMTCNFTVPTNEIFTDYKVTFTMQSQNYVYNCSSLTTGTTPSERICNITDGYRPIYPHYTFKIISNNTLGTLTQVIDIDHMGSVVPARPAVKIGNITANSVKLFWEVTKYSHYYNTKGLQYEIRLRPDKFDWIDFDSKLVHNYTKDYSIYINELEYAFRKYDVSVRVRTAIAAEVNNNLWSEAFYGSFVTSPRRPDNPPAIDVGSFYIDPVEQNLRIYWQQLPEYRENGPDFKYSIEVQQDGHLVNIAPVLMDHTSAKYQWQSTSHYEFKVKSQNQVGQSLDASILNVHPSARSKQIEQIKQITKVFHNQIYTISWQQPSDMKNLMNFTVFWCISKMESQSQCKGTINFVRFDKNTYNYTTEPQNHTLNFAVSANYRTYSTGMIWAMCTADVATDLTKMYPETTTMSSKSIKVQWSTECLYPTEGYNLTYCKVENDFSQTIGDCIGPEKTIRISKMAKEYIMTGLESFSTYKISILMYSKVKVGPISNPVLATTTEDAPTPPRKLKYLNVTSDSVVISWLPPKHSNGNLRYYTVWENSDHHLVNSTANDTESEITFKLFHLSSFTDYKIYLTAHTVKSSPPSNDIHIKTLMSVPSAPRSLNINKGDKSLELRWDTPAIPAGPINFYEIRVNVWKKSEILYNKISRVVGHECILNFPLCHDLSHSYTFDVRAVNVAKMTEVEYHTFSKREASLYTTMHQGAAKRRRHSNAEINSSIGGAYLIHETAERHLRHRHERENLKSVTTSTTELPFENRYNTLDDGDESLICIGGQQDDFRRYNDPNQFKIFNGPFASGALYACGEAQLSKMTVFALGGVITALVMLALVYSARKKYYKMSSIGLVIPAGLDENIHTPKGVDNTIEHDEINRSDEQFYENKENHRLLSKVGNDSGFLNSIQCLDKNSGFACSDHQDSEKSSQSTDSVELNDITSCSYTSSPSHSPNANVRESTTPEDKITPLVIQPTSVQLRSSDNGYIKPMMSNGYVQPQALQKMQAREPPSFNGYTTLDAMGKPVFSPVAAATSAPIGDSNFGIVESKAVSSKDIATPQPVNGNICGYVTHKQLSDFGQRLQ